jgi:hypothetical protein
VPDIIDGLLATLAALNPVLLYLLTGALLAGEEEACALRRQFLGHRAADLASGSDDDRGLVVQASWSGCSRHRRHGSSLPGIADERGC